MSGAPSPGTEADRERDGSSVAALLELDPADDAGAETAARYEWQAAMAAADALSMLLAHVQRTPGEPPTDDSFLVCELHEDWIGCEANQAQLVSAKHREASQATVTTLVALVDDLGLGHLFSRWHQSDSRPATRLVTNAALTGVCGEVVKLCRALASGSPLTDEQHKVLTALGRELMFRGRHLPERWERPPGAQRSTQCTLEAGHLDDLLAFCAWLTVDPPRPGRQFVGAAAANLYAAPVVAAVGGDPSYAEAVWQAVLVLVRRAMQAGGASSIGALPEALGGIRRTRAAELESRVIRLRAVAVAVEQALANPAGFLPLRPAAQRQSRLQIKMRRGGCTGTSITRAEMLRSDYLAYVDKKRTGVPLADVRTRLLPRNLHRIADEAVQELADGVTVWGRSLWRDLPQRLLSWDDAERPRDLSPDVALGGVADLIEHCLVWMSDDESDVDAELLQARTAALG